MEIAEISIHDLKARLEGGDDVVLIDVRESDELEHGVITGAIHIPMNSIPERLNEVNSKKSVVVICRTGNRSRRVTQYLLSRGYPSVLNLSEGMNGWASEIDQSMTVY